MTTSRFDPIEDKPYGRCKDCAKVFLTKSEADKHMESTFEASVRDGNGARHGHSVRVSNPDRDHRIEKEVDRLIDGARRRLFDDFWRLIAQGDVTVNEMTDAVDWYFALRDPWKQDVMESES